jgi:hypothetical protein
MFNTDAMPHPRPRPGYQEFSAYSIPEERPRHLLQSRNVICTIALLTLIALAFLTGCKSKDQAALHHARSQSIATNTPQQISNIRRAEISGEPHKSFLLFLLNVDKRA